MSTTPILHHYAFSTFSEKVRVCLGLKQLSWGAVDQPVVMLTGHGTVELCRRAFKAGAIEFLVAGIADQHAQAVSAEEIDGPHVERRQATAHQQ